MVYTGCMYKDKTRKNTAGGITDQNQDFIFQTMKRWKERAELLTNLYQKAETPEAFYLELQLEQILNKQNI